MGLFGTLGSLFGKKKGGSVQEYYSDDLRRAMEEQGRDLAGYAEQDKADAARARGQWLGDRDQFGRLTDQDISMMGGYMPGGLQERRYGRGIDQYERAQMGALQDAFDRSGARANQQQALMGSGGAMSPYMAAMLGNQMGAQGRSVAADVQGRRLGNIGRFQDTGLGLMGRRGQMLKGKTQYDLGGFDISKARDASTQGRTGGLIKQYGEGSWLRKKPDKLNWFGKLAAVGETLSQGHPFASPQQQAAGGNLANTPYASGNMGGPRGASGASPWQNMKSAWNQGGQSQWADPSGQYGAGYPVANTGGGSGFGNFMKKAGPALAAVFGCWVAREVFGNDNPKWLLFYHWKETQAPCWFKDLYNKHGEAFAEWISDKPRIKSMIRWWMESRINSLNRRISYATNSTI